MIDLFSKLPVRQLTIDNRESLNEKISKLPVRQLTPFFIPVLDEVVSKLPVRQLTFVAGTSTHSSFSKLPVRQLTVFFCANILILSKLASSYSYLTKILYACQKP